MFLVVPFRTEEAFLPALMRSLAVNHCDLGRVGLIGVDHNSTDQSACIFRQLSSEFGYSEVIDEDYAVPCVGVPRKRGLDAAHHYATLPTRTDPHVAIGSVDCDAVVNEHFLSDALGFASAGQSGLLVYPSRHVQQPLIDIATAQDSSARALALRVVLGTEWLKFQLRELLYSIGANETRGSSGYFLAPRTYEALGGHRQPFNEEGQPISGESNRLGIMAAALGIPARVSRYLTLTSPRRFVKAILQNSGVQGYLRDRNNAKLYTPSEALETMPRLTSSQWAGFYRTAILGALGMLLTRAVCYHQTQHLRALFPESLVWPRLVQGFCSYFNTRAADQDCPPVGSGCFQDAFETALDQVTSREIESLTEFVDSRIPPDHRLMAWSRATVHHPQLDIA